MKNCHSYIPCVLLLSVATVLCIGCPLESGTNRVLDELIVMTWNVQNLMDGIVDGTEYDEYLPKAGWNADLYRKRLKNCVGVITDKNLPLPHILVLQEIENDRILADLLAQRLARLGFSWYAATGEPGSAIQTGLVSRIPVTVARVHAVPGCRPVLECEFDTAAGKVVVLAAHGKSRREGAMETEPARIALSRTIRGILENWRKSDPSALLLVAGDFNESPDSSTVDGAFGQTAFVEASNPLASDFSRRGSLVVSGSPSAVSCDTSVLYAPWLDASLRFSRSGSCWFSGGWHRYDQILGDGSLFDGTGWEFDGSDVGAVESLCAAEGTPFSWNVRTRSGISDHFPVWVRLKRIPPSSSGNP